MKLYLDAGHGGSDPGAQGNGLKEKDITLDIATKIRTILISNYENVDVKMSRTTDIAKSLSQRTNEANSWSADYFLSIHCNAFNGTAQGYEDYIHNSLSDGSTTANYRDILHREVSKVNQLINRGKKKANFHVLRESAMPAALTENGFIDNEHDADLMKKASWLNQVAQGHVNGLAKIFQLQRKEESDGVLYKVIAGSFKSAENASERVKYLLKKGIDSFVFTTQISGESWCRVQAGSFKNKVNAEQQLTKLKNAGIQDAFIITEGHPSNQSEDSEYTIFGQTFLSPQQMNQFVKQVNSDAIQLGNDYLIIGEYYGIRGDVAFAQAMHETDYLRFTGVVKPEQNNFCGLGATGPDNPGASFDTPRDGVIAHLQHLFAYASTEPLPSKFPLLDPRFDLVNRGSATTWTALNGKWAVPGDTYGQLILSLYARMIGTTIDKLEEILQEINA